MAPKATTPTVAAVTPSLVTRVPNVKVSSFCGWDGGLGPECLNLILWVWIWTFFARQAPAAPI